MPRRLQSGDRNTPIARGRPAVLLSSLANHVAAYRSTAVLQVPVPASGAFFRRKVETGGHCVLLEVPTVWGIEPLNSATGSAATSVRDDAVLLDLVEQRLVADTQQRSSLLPVPPNLAQRWDDDVPFCPQNGLIDSLRERELAPGGNHCCHAIRRLRILAVGFRAAVAV